jgi:hypothetical protein
MENKMLSKFKTATVVAFIAGGAAFATGASAQVGVGVHVGGVGVGVGVGAPDYYYNQGYYPPGPCASYDHYYDGDCGYPVTSSSTARS